MADLNRAYALQSLSCWSSCHGIYEIREVLKDALEEAAKAESGEALAATLLELARAPQVPPQAEEQEPAAGDESETTEEEPTTRAPRPARSSKPKPQR